MAKKVLLVEDSPLDAAMIKDMMSEDGFEMYVANTVKEGYEKAVQVKPDLILLDLLLPDGNGFDLCARIRKESGLGNNVLIVIVSIKSDRQDIEKAFESGADDYVIKPPAPEFLLKKIRLYMHP
ncbi:MAG: response regulator [Candidatus Omnitrophota bacterium]